MENSRFFRSLVSPKSLSDHVKAKWEPGVLDEGFTPFPKRLIRAAPRIFKGDEGVDLLAAILAIVDFRMPGAMWSAPTLEFLAFTSGVSPSQFERYLERLQELGLVHVRRLKTGEERRLTIDLEPLYERIKKESRDEA
jgi:hypothetical protein